MCVCVRESEAVKERQKQRGNVQERGMCVCMHVNIYPDAVRLQSTPDNVWRGMFLIGLLAMQLSSRAMPPVRHWGVNNWG